MKVKKKWSTMIITIPEPTLTLIKVAAATSGLDTDVRKLTPTPFLIAKSGTQPLLPRRKGVERWK